jgi:hypothetical protein
MLCEKKVGQVKTLLWTPRRIPMQLRSSWLTRQVVCPYAKGIRSLIRVEGFLFVYFIVVVARSIAGHRTSCDSPRSAPHTTTLTRI